MQLLYHEINLKYSKEPILLKSYGCNGEKRFIHSYLNSVNNAGNIKWLLNDYVYIITEKNPGMTRKIQRKQYVKCEVNHHNWIESMLNKIIT